MNCASPSLNDPKCVIDESDIQLWCGDCIQVMNTLPSASARLVIADPPYFNVLKGENWDTDWEDQTAYLYWTRQWMNAALQVLAPGGTLWCFGQVGQREHVMLHLMSQAVKLAEFHDLIVWDRVVGYSPRRDSFTPAYEMAIVLRKTGGEVCFNRDLARETYSSRTIAQYLKDKRYKNRERRLQQLQRGKIATNLWRIPSLKGHSHEKVGHPSQKPLALIERIIQSSSRENDLVLDPFCGSGTTLEAARHGNRRAVGIEISPAYCAMIQQRLDRSRK